MSCQLHFDESDIYSLPFRQGDDVNYKGVKVTITSIYIRPFGDTMINDIIVTFSNGDYTFHDDHELKVIR